MSEDTSKVIKLTLDKSKQLNTHYLESLDISVGLENRYPNATLIIDSLALRFQSRSSPGKSEADPQTTIIHPGGAREILPTKLDYYTIRVCPHLLFLKYTNVFDVAVGYRFSESVEVLQSFIGNGGFVLIQPAPQLFGRVFVSYKEPEDRALANLLYEFATDAGFNPYMAPPDIKTGSQIWRQKIPAEIKNSKFMLVIWTRNSLKGPGVRREIKIARENGVSIVPLLEKKTADPKIFGRDVEYTRFDSDNAAMTFASVIAARRQM
jgi:hypothetical protein